MLLQSMTEVMELGFREAGKDEYNIMILSSTAALFYLTSKGYKLLDNQKPEKYIRIFKDRTFYYSTWKRFDLLGIVLHNTLYVPCTHHDDEPVKGIYLQLTKGKQ